MEVSGLGAEETSPGSEWIHMPVWCSSFYSFMILREIRPWQVCPNHETFNTHSLSQEFYWGKGKKWGKREKGKGERDRKMQRKRGTEETEVGRVPPFKGTGYCLPCMWGDCQVPQGAGPGVPGCQGRIQNK